MATEIKHTLMDLKRTTESPLDVSFLEEIGCVAIAEFSLIKLAAIFYEHELVGSMITAFRQYVDDDPKEALEILTDPQRLKKFKREMATFVADADKS